MSITLYGPLADVETLLRNNSIDFNKDNDESAHFAVRAKADVGPFLSIEATQLFNNPSCAMTYLQKDWRANPFAPGDLGKIDIGIKGRNEGVFLTAILPCDPIMDETLLQSIKQDFVTLIAQGQGLMSGLICDDQFFVPYILLPLEINDPSTLTTEQIFSLIQLFALEVHRIFGTIVTRSGESVKPPVSSVSYTPDVQDANGGYFVYGPNGHLWWLIDSNFRFQSVVGAGVWQEFKDAEAGGLPLTATDMDNIYHYKDGIVYDNNSNAVGRYYAERIDRH